MKKILSKYGISGVILLLTIVLIIFSLPFKEKIKVSNITWEIVNGEYLVSFDIKNKTQKKLETNMAITVQARKYAGGSPKAEIIEVLGAKKLFATLNPSQSREFNEIVKPKTIAFPADFVTVTTWEAQAN